MGLKTLVIIVNWNGWTDTVECLDSLCRMEGEFEVVICDNDSGDGSLEHIEAWIEGSCKVKLKGEPWARLAKVPRLRPPSRDWIHLLPTGGNWGFAGGNNVGLEFGLARGFDQFWILNNDTAVTPGALVAASRRLAEDPAIGICGSTLLVYERPETVQCWGGARYRPERAGGEDIGHAMSSAQIPNQTQVERDTDFIIGAAMLVPRCFVERVGPLCEDYFLYFEEMEWALRGRREGFRLGYAPTSVVYHKHGATIGGTSSRPSNTLIRFMTRNRILFTRQHFPTHLPTVLASIAVDAAKLFVKGRRGAALRILGQAARELIGGPTPIPRRPIVD